MDSAGPPTLGQLVRSQRQRLGLSQEELARRAGLSVRTLRDIERDRVATPRQRALRGLAGALGIAMEDLVPGGAARPAPLWLGVLGPLVLRRGATPVRLASPIQRDLLGLLCLYRETTVSQDEIIDVLWDTDPPKTCRNQIHVHIGRLRRGLGLEGAGGPLIVTAAGGYRLVDVDDHLDLAHFDRLANPAGAALDRLREALQLWRGPVLADAGGRLRRHPAAVAAHRRRVGVALEYADLALRDRDYANVVAVVQALLDQEPLHEGLHARLMLALAGSGAQAAALQLFREVRDRLTDELGIEPGGELRDAQQRVLRQELSRDRALRPAQLPPGLASFAGRERVLARLDSVVDDPRPAMILAITGTAGVGKTALAVHWAHRVSARFPDGQLHVDLRGFHPTAAAMSPGEALRGFLGALGVAPTQIPAAPAEQASLYRSRLAGRRVLVVLDNARSADQVRPLLPGSSGCLALVTSRDQLTGLVAAEGAYPVALDLLDDGEARELLRRRLGAERVAEAPDAVSKILARCANLPLALAVVAARAAVRTQLPLSALAAELTHHQDPRPTALRLLPHGLTGNDPVTDVRAVLSWSYRTLSPPAARLFRLLGLQFGADISTAAAASLAGLPVGQIRAPLAELCEANLLDEPVRARFTCHDLLRSYAAELAETEPERVEAQRRLLDHYLHSADGGDRLLDPPRGLPPLDEPPPGVLVAKLAGPTEALAWFTAEHQALLAAFDLAVSEGEGYAAPLARAVSTYLDRQSMNDDMLHIHTAMLEDALRRSDEEAQVSAHRALALAYVGLGRPDDAHAQLSTALVLCEKAGNTSGAAGTHHSIGFVLDRQGRYAEALSHVETALKLYRVIGHRPREGRALNAIGWCHTQLGDPASALVSCREALAVLEEIEDQYGQSMCLDSIGFAHHQLGQYAEAISCFERSLALQPVHGERLDHATSLMHLGDSHQAIGDLAAARDAWRRALAFLDDLDTPGTAELRRRLELTEAM